VISGVQCCTVSTVLYRDGLCDLYVYRCQILSTSPHCLHSPRHDLAMKYAIMDY